MTRCITVLFAVSASVFVFAQAGCKTSPDAVPAVADPAELGPLEQDVRELCRVVEDNYVYFADRAAHWPEACALAAAEADEAVGAGESLAVIERLLDELHDPHVSLGTNSDVSPRLVPSGADYRLTLEGGRATVVAVRPGSGAAKAGLEVGDVVESLDAVAPAEAALKRIRTGDPSPARLDWAVNAMAAGYRGSSRQVTVTRGEARLDLELADATPAARPGWVEARMLDNKVGYIRINNGLGESAAVTEFNAALETLKGAKRWVLDLRDTPGGGGTAVAEPMLGRFIDKTAPYQRTVPPNMDAIDRPVEPVGPWTAQGPMVVLVGRWTGSMGEGMAVGLDALGRGHVIGSVMARLPGGVEDFELSQTGIPVRMPTYDLTHMDGTPRHQWSPPHAVVADNGDGPDLALQAAEQWLSER